MRNLNLKEILELNLYKTYNFEDFSIELYHSDFNVYVVLTDSTEYDLLGDLINYDFLDKLDGIITNKRIYFDIIHDSKTLQSGLFFDYVYDQFDNRFDVVNDELVSNCVEHMKLYLDDLQRHIHFKIENVDLKGFVFQFMEGDFDD